MTTEAMMQQFQSWRKHWMRKAWTPITVDGDSSRTASKFAGLPWLASDEPWPTCPQCSTVMPLFLQLNLAHLPQALRKEFGRGLLQLFYCTSCDDGWEAFATTSLVRLIQPTRVGALVTEPPGSFPPKTITAWEAFEDFPGPPDHPQLGLDYQYERGPSSHTKVTCPAFGIAVDVLDDDDLASHVSSAAPGDKLAGWPYWIQGPEYPTCPRCQQQMRLVFQFDSEDHLPFTFGDAGTGHITQCPDHKEIVAFGWACT
jgi:uncharacterized protein YwqG